MPRFLNTWTGEFKWHNDPKKVRYAILSHVWRTPEDGGEQTYDDVRRIQAAVQAAQERLDGSVTHDARRAPAPYLPPVLAPTHTYQAVDWPRFPRPDDTPLSHSSHSSHPSLRRVGVIFSINSPLSDKIKQLCKVARDAGFDLVWNDTCCIDKSSSAELSEAINSMYEWYRLSDMCYVYLADVPDRYSYIPIWERLHSRFHFQESRWHTRGWTLQELIAAERIEFLSSSWRFLGTKLDFTGVLAQITGIDVDILLGRAPVDSASVARRMSWAAERETTRVEDRAYSLMGLFGIHMSLIYGEGTNAFLRLQEEVIRTIPDQSIFAWGPSSTLDWFDGHGSMDIHDKFTPCLLASSPHSFLNSTVRPISLPEFASRLELRGPEDAPPLDCVFAPQGTRMRLLCRFMPQRGEHPCNDRAGHRDADRLALLQCEDGDGRLIGLALHSSDLSRGGRCSYVGTDCNCSGNVPFRTILLSRDYLAEMLKHVKPETAEVCILHHFSDPPPSKFPLPHDSLPVLGLWPGDRPDGVTFTLSHDSVESLRELGFAAYPLQVMRRKQKITLETTLVRRPSGFLHSILLRITLERLRSGKFHISTGGEIDNVRFCFSSAASFSPIASRSAAISCASKDSEVPGSGSKQIRQARTQDIDRRLTLAHFDQVLILPYSELHGPLQHTRRLRLSLERSPQDGVSFPNSSRTVFLVIRMGMRQVHATKSAWIRNGPGSGDTTRAVVEANTSEHDWTRSELLSRNLALSPPPRDLSGVVPQSSDATTMRYALLEEKVDALGRQNNTRRAQVSTVAAEMETKLATRASQNAAIASQNATLVSRMASMWQDSTPSPQPQRTQRQNISPRPRGHYA